MIRKPNGFVPAEDLLKKAFVSLGQIAFCLLLDIADLLALDYVAIDE